MWGKMGKGPESPRIALDARLRPTYWEPGGPIGPEWRPRGAIASAGEPLPAAPSGEELARAEADVQDVFGAELAKARKPADKVAVAGKMIETAEGSRPAATYALLVRARGLAIAAGDSTVGVRAVEELVAGFAAGKSQDAAAWASEGHRLWNAASDKRPPEKLRARLDAAECYLRGLEGLTGFQRAAVEKRLRELGWRVGPIDFNFEESTEGWTGANHIIGLKAERGCLEGRITGGDPFIVRTGLAIDANQCPVVQIRMTLDSAAPGQFLWITKSSPRWGDPKVLQWAIHGDGQTHVYRLDLTANPAWAGQTITGLRIDPGERDHVKPHSGKFWIDYVRGSKP